MTKKSIFSHLAEQQTVRINNINARVSVRVHEWKNGEQTETTNDVMVDGYCYTPSVSDNWLPQYLAAICDIVAAKPHETHLGHGQWKANHINDIMNPQNTETVEHVRYIIQEHSCNDWYDYPDTEEYKYEADAVMEAARLAKLSIKYKYCVVRRSERIIWKNGIMI